MRVNEDGTFTMHPDLPRVLIRHPECGWCEEDLRLEDGSGICDDCGLFYGDLDEDRPPVFLDPEAEPCGHMPAAVPDLLYSRWESKPSYAPCILPEGHSLSWGHLCPFTYTPKEVSP